MTLRITGTEMASEQTAETAILVDGGWSVSWLPGRVLTRNQAITALTVAEEMTFYAADREPYQYEFIRDHAAELGLTAGEAIDMLSLTPRERDILGDHQRGKTP